MPRTSELVAAEDSLPEYQDDCSTARANIRGRTSEFVAAEGSLLEHQDQDPAETPELLPGAIVTILDTKLEVVSSLGNGGFGDVYLTQEVQRESTSWTPKQMAMKVPKVGKTWDSALIEAAVAVNTQALTCEHAAWKGRVFIPWIFAVGEAILPGSDSPRLVLLMEAAHGTLHSLMEDQALSGEAVQCIAWALATTLNHLHADGCVHGDLKPMNVLWRKPMSSASSSAVLDDHVLGSLGWPLLADFGSSQDPGTWIPRRILQHGSHVNTKAWTPHYAAPEVKAANEEGRGLLQSVQSDMFSWAMMLEEVIMCARSKGSVQLSKELQGMLLQCTSESPKDRPDSFAAIAAQIKLPICHEWAQEFWRQHRQDLGGSQAAALRHSLECLVQAVQRMMDGQSKKVAARTLRFLAGQRLLLGEDPTRIQVFMKEALDKQVDEDEDRLEQVQTIIELGAAAGQAGDMERSVDYYRSAVLQLSSYDEGDVSKLLGAALIGLAQGYIYLAQKYEDPTLYILSVKLCEQSLQIDPRDPHDITVANCKEVMAQAYQFAGNPQKSIEILHEVLKVMRVHYGHGQSHPDIAKALYNMADAYLALDDIESMSLFRDALFMDGDCYGNDASQTTHAMVALGRAGLHFGQRDNNLKYIEESIPLLAKALEIRVAELGPDHADVAEVAHVLKRAREVRTWHVCLGIKQSANAQFSAGRLGEALKLYAQVIQGMSECSMTEAQEELGKVHANMAECYLRLEQWEEAIKAATAAVVANPANCKAWFRRAKAREAQNKIEEALADARAAAALDLKVQALLQRLRK